MRHAARCREIPCVIAFVAATIMAVSPLRAAETKTYFYTDPQGNILAEADADGNITTHSDWRPYGARVMGSMATGPGFNGHVEDTDPDLVYMQARYYDAYIGRFLSRDPVGPSAGRTEYFNRYSYVGDNPLSRVDPFGKYICEKKDTCQTFDQAYTKVKSAAGAYASRSPQGKALGKVLAYYGEPGQKNATGQSVYIREVALGKDVAGTISHNVFTGSDTIELDFSSAGKLPNSLVEMAGMVAHEGQHGVDDGERRALGIRETGDTVLASERNAYRTQSYVSEAFGVNSAYRLWRSDWPGNEIEARRSAAVEAMAQESLEGWKNP